MRIRRSIRKVRRRDFIAASGSTILSGVAMGNLQKPVVGLDFEISKPRNQDLSNVDSIAVDFRKLELTPNYLDEKENLSIVARLEVDGRTKESNTVEVSFTNGQTEKTARNVNPIILDGVSANLPVKGTIVVEIDHVDISESYSQSFKLENTNPIQTTDGDRIVDIVDRGGDVITEDELGSGESLDDYDGAKYRVHVFEQVGTQSLMIDSLGGTDGSVDILLVGGGGAGGNTAKFSGTGGGGGGAGGLVYKSGYKLSEKTYDVTVGDGGSGNSNHNRGESGENTEIDSIVAYGGGGGASSDGDELNINSGCLEDSPCNGADGGSGGGGGHRAKPVQGIDGQGHRGGEYEDSYGDTSDGWGPTSGGGGAGEPGEDARGTYSSGTEGGDGLYYGDVFGDIFGASGWFAGGGGGGNGGESGGKGGGGQAALDVGESGEDGQLNTGGGGGSGSAESSGISGDGGSGIVLLRYRI